MKEDNPSISTEAIEANVSKYVARYNKMMKEIKSLAKQYKEDFQNTVSASDGYDKLSNKGQSFLSGIAGNIIDFDNANEKDLTDDNITKKRKDLQKITKEFTKNKKAQEDLDELVKTTNKTGGKSAKKWSEDVQDAYNDLTKTLGKKVDGKTLSAALEDAFDFKFSKDGDILHNGKDVESMISSIQDKLGDNKDTTKFLDGLDFTEMSQAFDILNSKTEKWTGSLDQLKERLKLINQTKSQSTWSDYLQAKETADSGDTYLAMREAFNAQKKERDKGLIGTDDFKTLTSVMSSSGKTDAATFDKTWAKTTKYFTSDNSGLVKFLDDLSAKSQKANTDFGTLKKTAEGTYSGKITNTASAAKAMGMGIEPFEAVLNRLKDYGGKISFKSVVEDYNDFEDSLNGLADKWDKMNEGAGKTTLGKQIEEYRQKLIKLKNAEKEIPDDLKKSLEFTIKVADYTSDLNNLREQYKINEKSMTTKEKNENLTKQVSDANNILYNMTGGKDFGKGGLLKGVQISANMKLNLKDSQSEIDKLSEEFSKATGEKRVKIGVELTQKQTDLIEQLNKLLPKDKQIPINIIDNATPEIKKLDTKKIKDKKFAAYCKDHASAVLLAIKKYRDSLHNKTITLTTKQKNIIENIHRDITDNGGKPKITGKKNGKGSRVSSPFQIKNLDSQAHGTAHAHGSFIPHSNAFAQGTVDDLTDWYDNELDDIEEFGAFAHGTIKKLGSRALAMGTTRISDLSEINPIVQAEKNKYLQEKTDKLKSSVGNAHANGGDWGLKQDERALTGELGDELVV